MPLSSLARALVVCALVACGSPAADAGRPATAQNGSDSARLPFGPCPWGGAWRAELRRSARTASGTVYVHDSAGPSRATATPGLTLRRWRGRYDVSIAPLFGDGEGGVQSTSAGGGTPDELRFGVELEPWGDSLTISFQPLVSHGPLSLWGVRRGDTISGEWVQRTGGLPPMPGRPDSTPKGSFTFVHTRGCMPA